MKIISTNIGAPQTIEWRGKQIETGIYKYSVPHPIFLGKEDVENDHVIDRRYHGGTDKACYLYSADHYDYWQKFYPELKMPWGMFGENLTVEGLHEAKINIGDTFKIGEVVVQATQPRQPCYKLGIRFGTQKMVKQFIDSGFAGVYVRVLQKGEVKAGDEVVLIEKKDSLSILKVYQLLYASEFEKEKENFEKAINDTFLAESCRNDLLKRFSLK
ncbi:MOSC domain-containing protein [Maribellus maritimus]|uniref:MOSC domain-containing protein n=1 Tax=Maribellus maritimus TaxID=2870838 RepID=UPI001EEC2463|nr:MOSC domain-containing protein [Maribellus maritimus]MCG6186893.1 MOSC domain-containing protein [Maribellus maritimus]